jgi:hypothetical protein
METCDDCGQVLNASGCCVNVDCAEAQYAATRGAARATQKAGATAVRDEPRAFTSSGRVD